MADDLAGRFRDDPIVEALRRLRKESGLSLAGVEAATGIKAVVLGSYERGDRVVHMAQLHRLLEFYGYELAVVRKGMPPADALSQALSHLDIARSILREEQP